MISRDYTQEVGLKSGTVRVPMPFAILALVLVAAGLWFSLVKLHASAPVRVKHDAHAEQTPAKPAPTAATATAVRHR